jgi:hypothetical protein
MATTKVEIGNWVVRGSGENRDYGRVLQSPGNLMLSVEWQRNGGITELPSSGIDVYTSRDAARRACTSPDYGSKNLNLAMNAAREFRAERNPARRAQIRDDIQGWVGHWNDGGKLVIPAIVREAMGLE